MVMNRWLIGAVSLAVCWMVTAGEAAAQGASTGEKPLDLTVPRQAGQWVGLAERSALPEPEPAASRPTRAAEAGARTRSQPYGTGYEARMSAGPAVGGPGRAAGPPPAAAPRGRGR